MAVAATATKYYAMGAGRTSYNIALGLCRQAEMTSLLHHGLEKHQTQTSGLWGCRRRSLTSSCAAFCPY